MGKNVCLDDQRVIHPRARQYITRIAIKMHNTFKKKIVSIEIRNTLSSPWACLKSQHLCAFLQRRRRSESLWEKRTVAVLKFLQGGISLRLYAYERERS